MFCLVILGACIKDKSAKEEKPPSDKPIDVHFDLPEAQLNLRLHSQSPLEILPQTF